MQRLVEIGPLVLEKKTENCEKCTMTTTTRDKRAGKGIKSGSSIEIIIKKNFKLKKGIKSFHKSG